MDRNVVYALIALALIVCFVIGYIAGFMNKRRESIETFGNLRIDRSDPDGPYLFLELDKDPSVLFDHETVAFKVVAKDYISTPQD